MPRRDYLALLPRRKYWALLPRRDYSDWLPRRGQASCAAHIQSHFRNTNIFSWRSVSAGFDAFPRRHVCVPSLSIWIFLWTVKCVKVAIRIFLIDILAHLNIYMHNLYIINISEVWLNRITPRGGGNLPPYHIFPRKTFKTHGKTL